MRRLRDNDDAAVVLSDGLGQRVDGLDVLKEARFRFRVSLQLATIKTRILRAIQGDSGGRVPGLGFVIPITAPFYLGRCEFGRTGCAAGQDGGTSKPKATQPRCATMRVTLCTCPKNRLRSTFKRSKSESRIRARLLVGSSRTMTSGAERVSSASATLDFCPPERSFILMVCACDCRPKEPSCFLAWKGIFRER